jgi:hypothetical protein
MRSSCEYLLGRCRCTVLLVFGVGLRVNKAGEGHESNANTRFSTTRQIPMAQMLEWFSPHWLSEKNLSTAVIQQAAFCGSGSKQSPLELTTNKKQAAFFSTTRNWSSQQLMETVIPRPDVVRFCHIV